MSQLLLYIFFMLNTYVPTYIRPLTLSVNNFVRINMEQGRRFRLIRRAIRLLGIS